MWRIMYLEIVKALQLMNIDGRLTMTFNTEQKWCKSRYVKLPKTLMVTNAFINAFTGFFSGGQLPGKQLMSR